MNFKILFTIIWGTLKRGYFINPFILYSQARLETGNFTSNIFKENKNLFGMKQPSKRDTLCVGTNRGHGVFKSLLDSVEDYVLRQRYFKIKATLFGSLSYMQRTQSSGYAEDQRYVTKWHNLYKEHSTGGFISAALFLVIPLASVIMLIYFLLIKKSK